MCPYKQFNTGQMQHDYAVCSLNDDYCPEWDSPDCAAWEKTEYLCPHCLNDFGKNAKALESRSNNGEVEYRCTDKHCKAYYSQSELVQEQAELLSKQSALPEEVELLRSKVNEFEEKIARIRKAVAA